MVDFTSNENKRMLWNIMIETNLFADVDEVKYTHVKIMFEKIMEKIKLEEGKSLKIKNKMVLSEMTGKLRLIKNPKTILTDTLNPQYSSDYRLHTTNDLDTIDFKDEIDENSVKEEDLTRLIQSREQIIKEVMNTMPKPEINENNKEIHLLDFLNKQSQDNSDLFKDIKLTCNQLSDGFKNLGILIERLESIIDV